MKYTTTKPQRGGCFASAARVERPRGLQTYPREAGEASELNSQNGSRALIGRRHSRTFNKERGRKKINAKKGGLSVAGAGGRREEEACVQDNYWVPPSKNKNRKEKKRKGAIFHVQARAASSQECEGLCGSKSWFPLPSTAPGREGCAGRRGNGTEIPRLQLVWGRRLPPPSLLVFKHTITPSKRSPFAVSPRAHLRSGQFGNSLGGPGGARRGVPRSWEGSPSRGR